VNEQNREENGFESNMGKEKMGKERGISKGKGWRKCLSPQKSETERRYDVKPPALRVKTLPEKSSICSSAASDSGALTPAAIAAALKRASAVAVRRRSNAICRADYRPRRRSVGPL